MTTAKTAIFTIKAKKEKVIALSRALPFVPEFGERSGDGIYDVRVELLNPEMGGEISVAYELGGTNVLPPIKLKQEISRLLLPFNELRPYWWCWAPMHNEVLVVKNLKRLETEVEVSWKTLCLPAESQTPPKQYPFWENGSALQFADGLVALADSTRHLPVILSD